jgi:hypothetical protein
MIYAPNCEWPNDPLPNQPATHLTCIVPFNFTSKLAGASGLRLFRIASPLAALIGSQKPGMRKSLPQ